MCTFILAWQVWADAPLVVAANRDELLGRPARPPSVIAEEPRIVAPRDEEAGGTWIGYNEHGLLAGVTNRWTDADLAGDRSRGLLVRDALGRASAEDAARFVEGQVAEHEYAGFNLVLADANAAILLEWDGRLRTTNFEPGVHVVVNVGADDRFEIPASRPEAAEAQAERTRRALEDLRPEPGEAATGWRERAAAVLRNHDYGFCVHGDGFGTRSSSLITIRADGSVDDRFADGPPCETAYETVRIDR